MEFTTDTPAWQFFAWISFTLAMTLMVFGIYYTPVDLWVKGYLLMGTFFVVGSAFTLSKMLRDRHEQQRRQADRTMARRDEL